MICFQMGKSENGRLEFKKKRVHFFIESATQTGQLSKIGECITNTFVVPYCSDSGRQVDMNENAVSLDCLEKISVGLKISFSVSRIRWLLESLTVSSSRLLLVSVTDSTPATRRCGEI